MSKLLALKKWLFKSDKEPDDEFIYFQDYNWSKADKTNSDPIKKRLLRNANVICTESVMGHGGLSSRISTSRRSTSFGECRAIFLIQQQAFRSMGWSPTRSTTPCWFDRKQIFQNSLSRCLILDKQEENFIAEFKRSISE